MNEECSNKGVLLNIYGDLFYNKPHYKYNRGYNAFNSKYHFKYGNDGYEEGTWNLDGFRESDYSECRRNDLYEYWNTYVNEYSDEYNEKFDEVHDTYYGRLL